MINYLKKIDKSWIILFGIVLISLLIRLWEVRKIGELIFDEVYFVNFARNYLTGISFFDIHPPLGKLIISLGIKIFGDNSLGWRIMSVIFGELIIILSYFTGKEIGGKRIGLFAAAIFALDGMFLVYSRLGLIDIFLIFFLMLAFYLFLKFANTKMLLYLILSGVALGLCASVKYIGGLIILVFIIMAIVKKISFKKYWISFLLYIVILPLIVYLGFFLFNFKGIEFFQKVIDWHIQSFNYNITLTEGHPYASKWWTWFLMLRPIWFYYKDAGLKIIGVDGMGNPIIWWSSLVIIPMLIWGTYKNDKNNKILLWGFLIFLLFWAIFSRVLFYYHALASFTFLAFGLAYWLDKLYTIPFGKIYVTSFFIAAIVLFIYFLPIWIGWPISNDAFYHRMWLKGWI